jgi:DNA adenine methylase
MSCFCDDYQESRESGGILAKVASFIKNGENGKGITSRWHPETLRRRILAIDQVKH